MLVGGLIVNERRNRDRVLYLIFVRFNFKSKHAQ